MNSSFPCLRRTAVAVGLLLSAFTLGGCVNFALNANERVTSGYPIHAERASFIREGTTTRDEVTTAFGGRLNPPRWTWREGRAVAYTWTTTNGSVGGVLGAANPALNTFWVQQTDRAFCVEFDEAGRVVRTQALAAKGEAELRASIERWLEIAR